MYLEVLIEIVNNLDFYSFDLFWNKKINSSYANLYNYKIKNNLFHPDDYFLFNNFEIDFIIRALKQNNLNLYNEIIRHQFDKGICIFKKNLLDNIRKKNLEDCLIEQRIYFIRSIFNDLCFKNSCIKPDFSIENNSLERTIFKPEEVLLIPVEPKIDLNDSQYFEDNYIFYA